MLYESLLTTLPKDINMNNDDFEFDYYDIPDARGLDISTVGDGSFFMNDPRTRTALHAPTSKDWVMTFIYVFGDPDGTCLIFQNHHVGVM